MQVRPLHFHRHAPSVAQAGTVDLADRSASGGRGLELCKRFADPHAQLLLDRFLDHARRHRLDIVLQSAQGIEVLRPEKIGAGR